MCKTSPERPLVSRLVTPGFSLIEVVAALGIFSVAIIMVIAMMTNGLQTETAIIDRSTANRLVGAINTKLASLGYDVVQGTDDTNKRLPWVPSTGLLFDDTQDPNASGIDTTSAGSKVLFANKTGDKVGTYTDPIWGGTGNNNAEKYFEVMLVRCSNPGKLLSPDRDPSSPTADTLLAASSVTFYVRVSWPAYSADGTPSNPATRATRGVLIFTYALPR
jgi:hypothetical protein